MEQKIKLSSFTNALIKNFKTIKAKFLPDDLSRINVSQTVSFMAILYEKIRNAVEYREDHLIRRAAIERILRRRFVLNPEGKAEAENLIRELLWARYFPNGSLGVQDIEIIQKLIDRFVSLKKLLVVGQTEERKLFYYNFLLDLLTCEVEELLSPESAKKFSLFTYFIFQVLRRKIKIENVPEDQKDAFFYVVIEKSYAKSDLAYLHYHLFTLLHKPLVEIKDEELTSFVAGAPAVIDKIEKMMNNPYIDKLSKYVRTQIPAFSILFEIFKRNESAVEEILQNRSKLWEQVDIICRDKYQFTRSRLGALAIKSLIYIFLTKMLFALILEFPLSMYFYGEVNYGAIGINSLFPPLLMLIIVSFVKIPGDDNTKRIYDRIVDIIDLDKSFETQVAHIVRKPKVRKPALIFGFTIFYSLTFVITLTLIYEGLNLLKFNMVSQLIFIFFVSIVTFFAYRIRQISKEYRLQEKESFFTPFVDFFFMPILSLGKFFSSEIAKLNFFIVIFDYLIEAPFKLIFEIIEEWISFVRSRKDEII